MNVIRLHQDSPVTAANLVWENPPEKTKRSGKYAEFTAALRQNENRWAVIATFAADRKKYGWSLSNTINSGKLVDFRPDHGRFEATCRTANGETRVYVRFIPQAVQVAR